MIFEALKNKLVELGYAESFVEPKLREFNMSILDNKRETKDLIKAIIYNRPNVSILRFFLDVEQRLINKFVFDGDIELKTIPTQIGIQMTIPDYVLDKKLCIIGITEHLEIEILVYSPGRDIQLKYPSKTYEEVFGNERNLIVSDYFAALTSGNRLNSIKAQDIIYILMTEFVIDAIMIDNLNPKIKLYDNASKYAESITRYDLKYINRKINKIEVAQKELNAKYIGNGVRLGFVSNDPYLKINELNTHPDFYLNKPSYVWLSDNGKKQDEIAIYTAIDSYFESSYGELIKNADEKITKVSRDLTMQFSNQVGYDVSEEYVKEVISKLNIELIVPSINLIKTYATGNTDNIEPIKYRFKLIMEPDDFEQILYNSIEDNIGRKYRYRFVENIENDLTTVGNKLNYTDVSGNKVIKQSVADFNMSTNTVIIKRETIIDIASIPQLLGYMYEDVEDQGTSLLPVPSIEVNFYLPKPIMLNQGVRMYNGTAVENVIGELSNSNKFYSIPTDNFENRNVLSNADDERSVIVRYLNSEGEVLKENTVNGQKINSIYVPEIIPIINDKQGKEWVCDNNQKLNIKISPIEENIIEVRYIKKLAHVKINYINKQGKPIKQEVVKEMQVGASYDSSEDSILTDEENMQWTLYQARPNKMVVTENEAKNLITLVYDMKKAEVKINYITKAGEKIKESTTVMTQANKKYVADIQERIVDSNNLVWMYLEESNPSVYAEENAENVINMLYDAVRVKVLVTAIDEDGQKVKDDILEFVQIGKEYTYFADQSLIDIYGRWWELDSTEHYKITVQEDEKCNVITIKYKKTLTDVRILFKDISGRMIKDMLVQKAQIGTEYTPDIIGEITDIHGFLWKSTDQNIVFKVNADESKNSISYVYEPCMTKVTTKYLDVEGNELLEDKIKEVQVGSKVIPEKISMLEGKDGRVWNIDSNNINEFIANRYEQENIITINYEPKLVDVVVSFKSVSGLVLKNDEHIKLQLGTEYINYNEYYKVTSDNGERWSVIRTEPARMYVKENSRFTLIYGEIQARILVKCVNVEDSKSIIEDVVINTKLGGVFAPNIQQKLIDKTKRKWKYIGDTGMSIIAKENEQENIVILNYEPEKTKVVVEYLNEIGQKVRSDYVKEEQIGSEISIKQLEKLTDDIGLGWKLKTMTATMLKVDEDSDKNKIVCTYEKLIAKVVVRYADKNGNEIIKARSEMIQVGKEYTAEIIDKVTDFNNKVWLYSQEENTSIKINEESNEIVLHYVPYKVKVTQKYVDLENNAINDENVMMIQVGSVFIASKIEEVKGKDGKAWIYNRINNERIDVSENVEKNIVTHVFDKKMVKAIVVYENVEGNSLKKDDEFSLQVGSNFKIEPVRNLKDKDGLGWILGENNLEVNIAEHMEDNIFKVIYDKHMVNVYDRFITKEEKEIIAPKITSLQVGTKYIATVEEQIIDQAGAHWVQSAKSDIKIFASSYKVEPIIVSEDEQENNVYIKYKPELIDVVIKYQNTLGEIIKKEDIIQAQIGCEYTAEALDRIVGNAGNKWMYNTNSKNTILVSEDKNENVILLSYEEQKASVTFRYQDEYGTRLKKPNRKLVQIGTTYIPQFENVIEDEQNRVWEYKERDVEKLEVKDAEQDNVITLIYIPLKVDVTLKIMDKQGNKICEDILMKAQLGSEFKPSINEKIADDNSKMYKFVSTSPESILVRETPIGSTENLNVINLTYTEVYSNVTVKYQDFEGNTLRNDETIQLQVGEEYSAKPIQFIKDRKENQWELVNNKVETIRVMENPKDNVIKFVYEVAKANILVRYRNVDGEKIKDDEEYTEQVGNEFIPKTEKFVNSADNRKWSFFSADPIKIKVGSINNIITLTYQEAKANVVVKYEDDTGRKIKENDRVLAQIGSRFKPKATLKVIYEDNEIWRLDHFAPNEIIVSETSEENVITQVFTNRKISATNIEESNFITKNKDAHIQNSINNVDDAENSSQTEAIEETPSIFTDEHLLKLEKLIALSEEEKYTVQELNSYNTKIVELLHQSVNVYLNGNEFDFKEINTFIQKEKDLIESKFSDLISNDKAGSKLLKVFEHITASENDDAIFGALQQRKAILITDYFMNKPLSISEHAMYICERGKTDKEYELIEQKIINVKNKAKELEELVETKSRIMYEKIMLDNYYKARTLPKDNYFKDNTSKLSLQPEIVNFVNNLLVKQTFTLLQKSQSLTVMQQNELEALISLLAKEQLETLEKQLEKIIDGKQKKNAQKVLKDILKNVK
ncbi:MAG: MucBP domain-containing protein [Clostridia bacterium]|nr:MucBP domain-containing protein [Clostridia bacterium]